MSRKTYFYALIIVGTFLNIAMGSKDALGEVLWLIINALLIIVAWGCVWMRLFETAQLRAELSILTILPSAIFIYLMSVGKPMLAYYSEFFNLVAWAIAALVLIVSIRPTLPEKKLLDGRDYSGSILLVLVLLYSVAGWASSSYALFLSHQQ